jgi:hypothetical protein
VYPTGRNTVGASLIATGQSGSDNFMAIAVYDYYKLYTLTNETHFLEFALFLERATKQVLDWDGTLGYKYAGLMNEAVTFAPRRGHGVQKWLPWLSVAVLQPLAELYEDTGSVYLPH